MYRRVFLHLFVIFAIGVLPGGEAVAQLQPGKPVIQLAGGVLPGIGVQTTFINLGSFYTTEGAFYLDASSLFSRGGGVQFAVGFGGAIRTLAVGPTIIGGAQPDYDLDVGLRFGPGLFFAYSETIATKNQRFSLFLEPFVRLRYQLDSGRNIFTEIGAQRPVFRFGLWFQF